jgi:8-oxo-dGTP diphosphatase
VSQTAAGGLVERVMPDGLRLAVVHRTRYSDGRGGTGDWVLPKGKPKKGETLEETAVREVREEAGCEARIVGPVFPTQYVVNGAPKTVTFFRMACESISPEIDTSEIDLVKWLTPREALDRLTYDSERSVVRQAYPGL